MQPADLQTICLDRIYGLLREGVWNSCNPNPFSQLPSPIVERLMEISENLDGPNPIKLNDVTLLLKSGKLRRLNLCPFNIMEEANTIMRGVNKTSVSFESIVLRRNNLVSEIISSNPQIVEAHLSDPKDLIYFQNYTRLKILRFYHPVMVSCERPRKRRQEEDREKSFERYIGSVLPSLSNLQVLYIPCIDTDTIVKILDTCPNIISLGLVDTLDSMEEITLRSMDGSLSNIEYGSHLQLRRCCWGKDYDLYCSKSIINRQKVPSQMKCAVSLCPLLEELIFHIKYKGIIRELRNFKKLTLLKIVIPDRDAVLVSEFFDVLQCIGPQLEHLSVTCDSAIPIDCICEYCPRLESLEINAPLFVKKSRETSTDLRLKRIKFKARESAPYRESIEFVLPKCKQLERLQLWRVPFLDDKMLDEIISINPFAKLNWIEIHICSLTEEGIDMLFSSGGSIRKFHIYSTEVSKFGLKKRLESDRNLKFLKIEEVRNMEFISQLYDNRF